ncbi:hypothetical protein ACRCLX_28550, partial [Escherichia coli]|uniref:hypothetical protein n=1 Tax=Escherichia coli TaxID=562 RepID=UPI003D969BED
ATRALTQAQGLLARWFRFQPGEIDALDTDDLEMWLEQAEEQIKSEYGDKSWYRQPPVAAVLRYPLTSFHLPRRLTTMSGQFSVGVVIGGMIGSTFRSAMSGTRRALDSLSDTSRRLQERQNALTRATERYGQLG